MKIVPATRGTNLVVLSFALLFFIISTAAALPAGQDTIFEPVVYLNFNEGSGTTALDASGNGNAGTIYNVSRVENGGCGNALVFDHIDNYVSIPYRTNNHPDEEITVSAWFFVDEFLPQDLVSSDREKGYRLGFGDGNDLWWTVNTAGSDTVALPIQHEGITTGEWHYVTGTYDGHISKIYLDGILRNQMNASGKIVYESQNYILLGANAGTLDIPDPECPKYLHGGLDEVRIYNRALQYGQMMDDHFRCSQEPIMPAQYSKRLALPGSSCITNSGTLTISPGESISRILTFTNKGENGTWKITTYPGSKLIVKTRDLYAKAYPDSWYIELSDESGRIDRSIAFPNTNNAPVEGVLPTGNATVHIRYFDGKERFPATVAVQFTTIAPPSPLPVPPQNILSNPIIVIYSASWATLIALIFVILWLHRRRKDKQENETIKEETKKD